jgi:large subunit ribosomal protein L17
MWTPSPFRPRLPRKDKDGKRVKEEKDGKKVTLYDDTVDKQIRKGSSPAALLRSRQLLKNMYPVVEVPAEAAGRKQATKEVDLARQDVR